jgi:hypothetical protein
MINETIISIALFSVFATGYYTPLNVITEWIVDKYIRLCIKLNAFWAVKASLFLSCAKCQAFMITLVYTWNLIDAILASMLALGIKYMINYVSRD